LGASLLHAARTTASDAANSNDFFIPVSFLDLTSNLARPGEARIIPSFD
jgi:hypothetical protein